MVVSIQLKKMEKLKLTKILVNQISIEKIKLIIIEIVLLLKVKLKQDNSLFLIVYLFYLRLMISIY